MVFRFARLSQKLRIQLAGDGRLVRTPKCILGLNVCRRYFLKDDSNNQIIEMNSKYSDSCDKPGSYNYNSKEGTPSPATSFTLHPNRQYNTILKGETQYSTGCYMKGEGGEGLDHKVKNYNSVLLYNTF